MSRTASTATKYADALRMNKEQKDELLIESYVNQAKADIATQKATLQRQISDFKLKVRTALMNTNLNAVEIINLRRNLNNLLEDLKDIEALEAELF